jgi:hypothetical protein
LYSTSGASLASVKRFGEWNTQPGSFLFLVTDRQKKPPVEVGDPLGTPPKKIYFDIFGQKPNWYSWRRREKKLVKIGAY